MSEVLGPVLSCGMFFGQGEVSVNGADGGFFLPPFHLPETFLVGTRPTAGRIKLLGSARTVLDWETDLDGDPMDGRAGRPVLRPTVRIVCRSGSPPDEGVRRQTADMIRRGVDGLERRISIKRSSDAGGDNRRRLVSEQQHPPRTAQHLQTDQLSPSSTITPKLEGGPTPVVLIPPNGITHRARHQEAARA
jgi:hypothetical protein